MKVMRQLFIVCLLTSWVSSAHAIRCLDDIITNGDTDFKVQQKLKHCGEVISKEVVGKKETTAKKYNKKGEYIKIEKERLIERWHIRVIEQGGAYCYPLTFTEGMLTEIGDWTKCD